MSKQSKLFGNSDSEEDCDLKTNTSYARHYDEFRKKEILSHLKDISDSDSSDDASTDEELVNPEFDKEFLKSLAFLKSKNPKKYQMMPNFFENIPTVEETIKEKQLSKSKKPMTVADYQRERLIRTEGQLSDNEDEQPTEESLTYVHEQETIRNELKKALDDANEEDMLFEVKEKSLETVEKEESDYLKWLAGEEVKVGEDAKVLKPLKDFWGSKKLPKADKFLRDYIVNKRYMDENNVATYEDICGLSDDEKEVEDQTEFENKYNFRFEEPENEFIKRFPRIIEDTVRAENNVRKEKRKERQERKAQEKEVKMKDLRELQNVRKREIEQKLLILKEVAGNDELTLKEDDLNLDFDPDEHDRRMKEMFNNDYYGIDEGDQKPEFPDIDEELNIENWDNFDKSKIHEHQEEEHCEDGDFNMDCDFDPELAKKKKLQNELIDMSKGRKRRKKISKLAEIIKKEKPVYDATAEKTYEEYLDEYYKLDYEDIIGDQPCRFRYTECVPNDFGLTVEEILLASNKELNQWASLKKTMQNRPNNVEMNDVEKYNRRRNNIALKKKIFASIYQADESENANRDEEESSDGNSKQQLDDAMKTDGKSKGSPEKNSKKTIKKQNVQVQKTSATITSEISTSLPKSLPSQKKNKRKLADTSEEASQPQAKKNKSNKQQPSKSQHPCELSENRLKAFGINPKKFKNKIKYGQRSGKTFIQKSNKKH